MILKINKVTVGSHIQIDGILLAMNKGSFRIGNNVRINSDKYKNVIGGDTRTSFVIGKLASLNIGNHVSISNSAFYCANNITIDDFVMIGGNCKIWDSDFHPIDPVMRKTAPNENFKTRPIHIKESAFIGGSTIILKGVTIGKNSVIGAGSVVSRDIPDNQIWAGNPAQFIKNIDL
ncbi:DapH/DapD/GlmU-related protein [Dyadobacter sp. NIV53]|uniref:acyltransferase n=1 Tax=Dyadobacter sp. NIV53 TaxID=2861765 RepID=UPI001C87636C|nr:acyltransferase [Dyadobacter sp. NIV53]